MAKIGSNANYSQIRSEVQIAFDKQGKSENLRFETGKELTKQTLKNLTAKQRSELIELLLMVKENLLEVESTRPDNI